jgi:hypothetical protein
MLSNVGLVGRVGQGRFGRGVVIITPPLDTVTGSAAAYSTRLLRTAYAGSAIRVRRSNDNAELDIGFSGNVLNTAALLTHCGANSGFVVTWYDQSGNSRNLTQSTQANQPRIVNAGAVDTQGGVPCVVFDATNDAMTATSWGTIAQPFTRNAVVFIPASASFLSHIINTATGTPNTADLINALDNLQQFAGSAGSSAGLSKPERVVFTSRYNGASSNISKNGSASSNVDPGSNALAGISLNRDNTGAVFGGITYQEVVVFESNLSDVNRQFLERNQGAYYGITIA